MFQSRRKKRFGQLKRRARVFTSTLLLNSSTLCVSRRPLSGRLRCCLQMILNHMAHIPDIREFIVGSPVGLLFHLRLNEEGNSSVHILENHERLTVMPCKVRASRRPKTAIEAELREVLLAVFGEPVQRILFFLQENFRQLTALTQHFLLPILPNKNNNNHSLHRKFPYHLAALHTGNTIIKTSFCQYKIYPKKASF